MLWYKNWLETRSRLVMGLIYTAFPVVLLFLAPHNNPPGPQGATAALRVVIGFFAFYWGMLPTMLAGSGIKTQTFRAQRGLHSSMFYTLSLPVSRTRLFVTRTSLGIVELAALLLLAPVAMWIMFPVLRPNLAHFDLLKYWLTVFACDVGFYSIGVLMSTFLDDLMQAWGSMLVLAILFATLSGPRLPAAVNVFRAMGADSPLFTHSLPLEAMAFSLGVSAILCSAAITVVRRREY